MFCKKCGIFVEDNAENCPNCGFPMAEPLSVLLGTKVKEETAKKEESEIAEPQSSFQPETKIIVKRKLSGEEKSLYSRLAAAFGILLLIVILVSMMYNTPSKRLVRHLEKAEYTNALALFEVNFSGKENVRDAFIKDLTLHLQGLKHRLNSGELTYDEVMKDIKAVNEMEISEIVDVLYKTSEEINALNDSKLAYAEAGQLYLDAKYKESVLAYKQVSSDDYNYSLAVAKLTEAIASYSANVLAEAKTLAESGNYTGAITLLDEALIVSNNESHLKELRDSYVALQFESLREDTLKKVNNLVKEEKFIEALDSLQILLDEHKDDAALKKSFENNADKYKTFAMSKIDVLVSDKYIFEAIDLVKSVLTYLPEDAVLKDKLRELENQAPVDLLAMTPIDSGTWTVGAGTLKNAAGKAVSPRAQYIVAKDTFAKYTLGGRFKVLRGVINTHRDLPNELVGTVKIYKNDILVYTTPSITKSTEPINFSVNIEGARDIKIEVSGGSDSKNVSLLLYDMFLFE